MSKLNVTAAELRALAGRAREIGTLEPFTDVALQWTGLAEKEIERLTAERDDLRDVLLRDGFVPCDIPACNCGSWHHRYGLPERMRDIEDTLAEAGHELSNANGNLPINALKALAAERDDHARWRADLADKLHDRETTISAAWEALRSAGVHSEATIDDGIRLLRRQLDECSQMLARQAATIRELTRPTEES